MTKLNPTLNPIAWASSPDKITGHSYIKLGKENPNRQIYTVPLYTHRKITPKFKMTQDEFNEFNKIQETYVSTLYEVLSRIHRDRGVLNEYKNLYTRLFEGSIQEQSINQLEFSMLWDKFNALNPEEFIEVLDV